MTDFYVALSIPGSNCFITANKTSDAEWNRGKITIDGFTFKRGKSRTKSLNNGVKLLWDALSTNNAATIHDNFMLLKGAGWTVDDKDFVKNHDLKPETEKTTKVKDKANGEDKAPTGVRELVAQTPLVEKVKNNKDEMREAFSHEPEETISKENKSMQHFVLPDTYVPGSKFYDAEQGTLRDKPVFERLDGSIAAVQGDITTIETDVMVNAANAQLIPGGGVDGAINKAAGPALAQAMADIGGTLTGNAVITPAYNLPAKFVAHAVGPIFTEYPEEKAAFLLENAYRNAFTRASFIPGCRKVTAPLLSTGVYGYPLDKACMIAVKAAREFNTDKNNNSLDILFVAFDDAAFAAITAALAQ